MSSYKYQAKITDDIDDAREIIKNIGRAIKSGHSDKESALANLSAALDKLDSARYYIDRG